MARFTGELHVLCEEARWDDVSDRLASTPASVTRRDCTERQGFNQWTPLMIACVRAPTPVLADLLRAGNSSGDAPKGDENNAARIADRSGSLPLHFVSCWRRDGDEACVAIELLLDAYPDAIAHTNQWGQTPLHSAFDGKLACPVGVLRSLLRISNRTSSTTASGNSTVSTGDGDRSTTVTTTTAEERCSPYDRTGGATSSSSTKQLPYDKVGGIVGGSARDLRRREHVATLSPRRASGGGGGVPDAMLDQLGEAGSATVASGIEVDRMVEKALLTADKRGRLPLHIACENGAPEPVIELLSAACPEACCRPNGDRLLPVHLLRNWAVETQQQRQREHRLRKDRDRQREEQRGGGKRRGGTGRRGGGSGRRGGGVDEDEHDAGEPDCGGGDGSGTGSTSGSSSPHYPSVLVAGGIDLEDVRRHEFGEESALSKQAGNGEEEEEDDDDPRVPTRVSKLTKSRRNLFDVADDDAGVGDDGDADGDHDRDRDRFGDYGGGGNWRSASSRYLRGRRPDASGGRSTAITPRVTSLEQVVSHVRQHHEGQLQQQQDEQKGGSTGGRERDRDRSRDRDRGDVHAMEVDSLLASRYPTALSTSIVETLLLPVVRDREAAGTNGLSAEDVAARSNAAKNRLRGVVGLSRQTSSRSNRSSVVGADGQPLNEALKLKQRAVLASATALARSTSGLSASALSSIGGKRAGSVVGRTSVTSGAGGRAQRRGSHASLVGSEHDSSIIDENADFAAAAAAAALGGGSEHEHQEFEAGAGGKRRHSCHPLPLHIAAEYGCSEDLMRGLLLSYPDGARQCYVTTSVAAPGTGASGSDDGNGGGGGGDPTSGADTTRDRLMAIAMGRVGGASPGPAGAAATTTNATTTTTTTTTTTLYPIDCYERGRAAMLYMHAVLELLITDRHDGSEQHQQRRTPPHHQPHPQKSGRRRRSPTPSHPSPATVHFRAVVRDYVFGHDLLFAYHTNVPTLPRIRVSFNVDKVLPNPLSPADEDDDEDEHYNHVMDRYIDHCDDGNYHTPRGRRVLDQSRGRDEDRLCRFEAMIKSEARNTKLKELGYEASLVWMWMCSVCERPASAAQRLHPVLDPYDDAATVEAGAIAAAVESGRAVGGVAGSLVGVLPSLPLPGASPGSGGQPQRPYTCMASVGRILSDLNSSSLWKLTFCKTPFARQGTFVKIVPTNRTVVLEAEYRAPCVTMEDMLDPIEYDLDEHHHHHHPQSHHHPHSQSPGGGAGAGRGTSHQRQSSSAAAPGKHRESVYAVAGTAVASQRGRPSVTFFGDDDTHASSRHHHQHAHPSQSFHPHSSPHGHHGEQQGEDEEDAPVVGPTFVVPGSLARAVRAMEPFFWQRRTVSFLPVQDALSWSSTCLRAYTTGVRLLPPKPAKIPRASFGGGEGGEDDLGLGLGPGVRVNGSVGSGSSGGGTQHHRGGRFHPVKWQDLSLILPDCTHSVFVTYHAGVGGAGGSGAGSVSSKSRKRGSGGGGNDPGGLLIVEDKLLTQKTTTGSRGDDRENAVKDEDAVVDVSRAVLVGQPQWRKKDHCRLRLEYDARATSKSKSSAGGGLSLWYNLRHGGAVVEHEQLKVSDVTVRQVIYASEGHGKTPLEQLLSRAPACTAKGEGDTLSVEELANQIKLILTANKTPPPQTKASKRRSTRSGNASVSSSVRSMRSIPPLHLTMIRRPLHYALTSITQKGPDSSSSGGPSSSSSSTSRASLVHPLILQTLIDINATWLLDTDSNSRTPLHVALLLLLHQNAAVVGGGNGGGGGGKRSSTSSSSSRQQQQRRNNEEEEQNICRIIRTLLVGPGDSALRLKDASGNLPLHIACTLGAPLSVLRILLDPYPDGTYRLNASGDLPLHLHVASGRATSASVELLLRPISRNESVLRIPGSRGYVLPIHIAAQYRVSLDLLMTLCRTHPGSVRETRQAGSGASSGGSVGGSAAGGAGAAGVMDAFALDILEEGREDLALLEQAPSRKESSRSRGGGGGGGGRDGGGDSTSSMEISTAMAEFNAKSDLLFVYYPDAISRLPRKHSSRGGAATAAANDVDAVFSHMHAFRKEPERLRRLEGLIRNEVLNLLSSSSGAGQGRSSSFRSRSSRSLDTAGSSTRHLERGRGRGGEDEGDHHDGQHEPPLSDTARMAWVWMCTYTSRDDDPEDNYGESIRNVLTGLPLAGVQLLANLEARTAASSNMPMPAMTDCGDHVVRNRVRDCASPICAEIIFGMLRFLGRYDFDDEDDHHDDDRAAGIVLHQSEVCPGDAILILRAKDYGLVRDYNAIQRMFRRQEEEEEGTDVGANAQESSSAHDVEKDDTSKAGGRAPANIAAIPIDVFSSFCRKLGVSESVAKQEIASLTHQDELKQLQRAALHAHSFDDSDASLASQHHQQWANNVGQLEDGQLNHLLLMTSSVIVVEQAAFNLFCKLWCIDRSTGIRRVVFKFMASRSLFERERLIRQKIGINCYYLEQPQQHGGGGDVSEDTRKCPALAPILEDYDAERGVSASMGPDGADQPHTASPPASTHASDNRTCGGSVVSGNGEEKKMDPTYASLSLGLRRHNHHQHVPKHSSPPPRRRPSDDDTNDNDTTTDDAASCCTAAEDKDICYAKEIYDSVHQHRGFGHDFVRRFSLHMYKYAVVLPEGDRDLATICRHESLGIVRIREYLLQVGLALQRLHGQSFIHGDVKMSNVIRLDQQHLTLIDLGNAHLVHTDFFGGISRKWSTAVFPPEMIAKVSHSIDQEQKLERYERYWKSVSDDARDLKSLTPDDISTITAVVKQLSRQRAKGLSLSSKATSRMESRPTIPAAIESSQAWKDIISTALITIAFDDLPQSLASCPTFEEFAARWNLALSNAALWQKIKPRTHSDKTVYMVRAFNDLAHTMDEHGSVKVRDAFDTQLLPYELLRPSEQLDIWSFGVLIFSLCSGGQLFPSNMNGNIMDVASFAELEGWDKKAAETVIMERVDDPLAQDLLVQILVPEEDRLSSMELVLRHPFFGPASSLEAQCILEKHEEEELMSEETTMIPRTSMTTDTLRRIDNSTEKQCKIIFEEEKVVVPTCFIVLPYELVLDPDTNLLVAPTDEDIESAVQIGKCLLEINKATSRLSFWLMMKKNLSENDGGIFKSKLKEWLKRARTEPGELVAIEIVTDIGCGAEYINICREMLEKGDAVSNARSYIKDPMGAAKEAIRHSTDSILKCYWPKPQLLYLVDEFLGVPVLSSSAEYGSANDSSNASYPLRIEPNTRLLKKLFLPFMNLTAMAVTGVDGLASLSSLLGLPPSFGIPDSWKDAEPGLIHRIDKPSSVAEFAVLQDMIKKQEQARTSDDGSTRSFNSSTINSSIRSDLGSVESESQANLSEMRQLEIFYREYDPMRIFSDLRRLTDGKASAIWTSEEVLEKIQGEAKLAGAENRLRELKKEYMKREKIADEIAVLADKVKQMKRRPSASSTISFTVGSGGSGSLNNPDAYGDNEMPPRSSSRGNVTDASRPTVSKPLERTKSKKKRRAKQPKIKIRPYFGRC